MLGNIGRGAWQTSAGKVSCSQAHLAHVCLKAPKKNHNGNRKRSESDCYLLRYGFLRWGGVPKGGCIAPGFAGTQEKHESGRKRS